MTGGPRLTPSCKRVLRFLAPCVGPMARQDVGYLFQNARKGRGMSPQTATMIAGRFLAPLVRAGLVRQWRASPLTRVSVQITAAGRAALKGRT